MIRTLVASLLAGLAVAASTPAAETAPAPAPAPTDAQPAAQAELDRLAALAVQHGFPDAAGARIYTGPISMVRRQGRGSTHTENREGLHLELADGRWLINLSVLVPAAEVTVDRASLKEVAPEALLDTATAFATGKGWNPGMMDQVIEQIAPADRDRVRRALGVMPIFVAGHSSPEATLPVHLIRLGLPYAVDVAVLCSLGQQWNPMGSDATRAAPLQLGEPDWQSFRNQNKRTGITVPPAEEGIRGGLFLHFRNRALSAGAVSPPGPGGPGEGDAEAASDPAAAAADRDAALAGAESLLPADAAEARAELALIRARSALPATVAADAPLAERLAIWDGDLARSDAGNQGNSRMRQGRVSFHGHPANGDTPLVASEADIDALLVLLEDPRPCRWLDMGRARTLGDNALRAIGAIIGCDPRVLIERDPKAIWTAEERSATAAALRAWWAQNRQRPLEEVLLAHVPAMAPKEVATLLERRPAERRAPLLAALATAWAGGPPASLGENTLAAVLTASAGHAELAACVVGWKVEGDLATFLAAFHLARGNRAPLAAQVEAALAAPGDKDYRLHQLIALLRFSPTPADVQRLVALLRGPLDQPATTSLVQIALSGASWGGAGMNLVQTMRRQQAAGGQEEADRHSQVLPLALYAVLLADERPAPEAMAKRAGQQRHVMAGPGRTVVEPPAPLATDLRIADLAGAGFQQLAWQTRQVLGDDLPQRAQQLAVDLSKPVAERDRQLVELRRLVGDQLAPALDEAGLPNLAPAGGPAAGDDKSLF